MDLTGVRKPEWRTAIIKMYEVYRDQSAGADIDPQRLPRTYLSALRGGGRLKRRQLKDVEDKGRLVRDVHLPFLVNPDFPRVCMQQRANSLGGLNPRGRVVRKFHTFREDHVSRGVNLKMKHRHRRT